MRKTWMKKTLSLLLTLVMLLGMLPAAQAADETINLTNATITQSTSAANKMTVKFPTPVDIYSGDTYTYKLYLYANSDYTGLVGSVVSNGSTASKDFAVGSTFTLTALAKNQDVTIEGYDGTDFSTLPNGVYYMDLTMVYDDLTYAGKAEVAWNDGVAPTFDLSNATISKSTSSDAKMSTKFYLPMAIANGTKYAYEVTLYQNADLTGTLGRVVSTGSTASKDFAKGAAFTLTMLGSNADTTIGEFDGTDYTKLPNGTYYLHIKMTYKGVVYENSTAIAWSGYVAPPQGMDLSAATLAKSTSRADGMTVKFPSPVAMTSASKHGYSVYLYADDAYTQQIAKVSSSSSTCPNVSVGGTITKTAISVKEGGAVIEGFDPADIATLPNGTYYLEVSITFDGVTYTAKAPVAWTGHPEVLDLTNVKLAQSGSRDDGMMVQFPAPVAMENTGKHAYSVYLYADDAYTQQIAKVEVKTATSTNPTVEAGGIITKTAISVKEGGATIEGFDPTNFGTLPNGTYYLAVSMTIDGIIYSGKTAVAWNGQVKPIDMTDTSLSLNTANTARININFFAPAALPTGTTYTYAANLYANSDYTGRIGRVVSSGSTTTFDYYEGDPMVMTVLSSNKEEGVTVEGWDGVDYKTLPTGTYYVDILMGINGMTYRGQTAVEWTKPAATFFVTFYSDDVVFATREVVVGEVAKAPVDDPVKEGSNFLGWYTADGVAFDFTTPITEAIDLYAKWETIPTIELIDFAFARMILGNALDMQFAFPKAGVETGAYVEVVRTAADGTEVAQTIPYADFKSATISGVAHFYITYSGIAAKEMADTIVATVYNKDGVAISNGWTDSVREYALRSLRAANATVKNKTMLVDMLNYGAAAQTYFGYNAADLANKDLTAEEKALATTAAAISNDVVKGAKNKGSRLILESSIKVQQAFSGLNADMYAVVEFTNYNGRAISETIPGSEFQIATVSIIELDQIVLADARTMYTLTIYNADGTVYDTHVDSVASYIARASENALHDAIMNFADGAYNYLKG